jgi:ectoine hydroxylase-related dioxygenase (phytanoyl-CoA dioxygenase family)
VIELLQELAASPGAVEAARAVGPGRRLGLVIGDGPGATVVTTDDGVTIDVGTERATLVVAMGDDAWRALRSEDLSIFGLLYSGMVQIERGSFDQFAAWEPAVQALLYGRPVYDTEVAAPFAGTDLARSFGPDDDPVEMAGCLDRNGFLHVRGVFGPDEVRALSREADRLRDAATPEDKRSWWATLADGTDVCCRVTFMSERSTAMEVLAADDRLARLAGLSGVELLPALDRNDGISVVVKHGDVAAGLADLPWHRDCGLGGHPLLCPGLNLGIQLDRADAAHGQLWFLAGSHHHGGPVGDPWEGGWPVVAIDTEPGDVTVHYGHVLHAAPAPTGTGPGRRAIYLGFSQPELFAAIPPGQAYNDVIYADGDGHVRNVAEQSLT